MPSLLDETLDLPSHLDAKSVVALQSALLERRGRALGLNGEHVAHVGGLGLQLLLSAEETWRADGQILTIFSPSEAMAGGLARLGAADLLNRAVECATLLEV
jgi:chemotaxis protein CheX